MTDSGNPLQKAGKRIAAKIERWLPDPFLLALILTVVAFISAFIIEGTGPAEAVNAWADGFWNLLTFTMQMVLILVGGYALVQHPRVKAGLKHLSTLPNTGKQAVVFIAAVAMVASYINWGIGLIVGGILAREVGLRAKEGAYTVHYPLVVAAAFMGHGTMWHAGLSSAVGLLIATPDNAFASVIVGDGVISASQTIFSPYMLSMVAVTFVYVLILVYFLNPSVDDRKSIDEYVDTGSDEDVVEKSKQKAGGYLDERSITVPADRINNSKALGLIISLPATAWAVYQFYIMGVDALNFNTINFTLIAFGLLLYLSPESYMREFYYSVESAAGIILQFHFYAGILGILAGSGLIVTITDALVSIGTPQTFAVLTWTVAGVVNFIIPSGGGQWIVMGEPILNAASELGVPQGQAASAFMFGDMHTNLLNPFWSLPLLGIAGLRARECFGYCVAVFLMIVPLYVLMLLVVPY